MRFLVWCLALSLTALPVAAAPKSKAPSAGSKPPAAARSGRDRAAPKSFGFSYRSSRGRLGIQAVDLTEELRSHFGSPKNAGILVSRVAPDSPAAKAGVKVGDVVTHIEKTPIDATSDVARALSGKKAGESVAIGIVRNQSALRLSARLDTDAPNDELEADVDLSFDGMEQLFEGKLFGKGWHKQWHWKWPSDEDSSSPPGSENRRREKRMKELEKRQHELEKKLKQRKSQRT